MKTFPTIHLNGTAKTTLLTQTLTAIRSLRQAQHDLAQCAPNGRDYYPQGDGALCSATDEHVDLALMLQSVMQDLNDLAAHIADQP